MGKIARYVSMVSIYTAIKNMGEVHGSSLEDIIDYMLRNTIISQGQKSLFRLKINKYLNFGVLARIFEFDHGRFKIVFNEISETNSRCSMNPLSEKQICSKYVPQNFEEKRECPKNFEFMFKPKKGIYKKYYRGEPEKSCFQRRCKEGRSERAIPTQHYNKHVGGKFAKKRPNRGKKDKTCGHRLTRPTRSALVIKRPPRPQFCRCEYHTFLRVEKNQPRQSSRRALRRSQARHSKYPRRGRCSSPKRFKSPCRRVTNYSRPTKTTNNCGYFKNHNGTIDEMKELFQNDHQEMSISRNQSRSPRYQQERGSMFEDDFPNSFSPIIFKPCPIKPKNSNPDTNFDSGKNVNPKNTFQIGSPPKNLQNSTPITRIDLRSKSAPNVRKSASFESKKTDFSYDKESIQRGTSIGGSSDSDIQIIEPDENDRKGTNSQQNGESSNPNNNNNNVNNYEQNVRRMLNDEDLSRKLLSQYGLDKLVTVVKSPFRARRRIAMYADSLSPEDSDGSEFGDDGDDDGDDFPNTSDDDQRSVDGRSYYERPPIPRNREDLRKHYRDD